MEDEDEVSSPQGIDFCTMGMFIIGKRDIDADDSFYALFTVFFTVAFYAKPIRLCSYFTFSVRCQVFDIPYS